MELGLRNDLGSCYWQWADVALLQGDWMRAKQKLNAALEIFSQLKLTGEQSAIRAHLKLGRMRGILLRLRSRLSILMDQEGRFLQR